MLIGIVKWFDNQKGFGVIGTPDNNEYFIHENNFTEKPEIIEKGVPIVFRPKIDNYKNRNSVVHPRVLGTIEDFKLIFSYLAKSDSVKLELKISSSGRGRIIRRNEVQSFSLIGLSLKYFLTGKSDEKIIDCIIDYFNTELDLNYFISFCNYIESRVNKYLPKDNALNILKNIFSHFEKNMNDDLLFEVWKSKKFQYILKNELEELEISESIFLKNIHKIELKEVERISKFSYGHDFCLAFLNFKFYELNNLKASEIIELYDYIKYDIEINKEKRIAELDIVTSKKILNDLLEKINELDLIKNSDDFYRYENILESIPIQISQECRDMVLDKLHEIILTKCDIEFTPKLWLNGIGKQPSFDILALFFLNDETVSEDRKLMLLKVNPELQFGLLKLYSNKYNFLSSLIIIEYIVKEQDSLPYSFQLVNEFNNRQFWKNKKSEKLVNLFFTFIIENCGDAQKYILFLNGFLQDISVDILCLNIEKADMNELIKIITYKKSDKRFIREILIKKITFNLGSEVEWIYDLACEFLDKRNFDILDLKIFDLLENVEYFKLWKKKKAKIFPYNYINIQLNDNSADFLKLKNWINKTSTHEEICSLILDNLKNEELIDDRTNFYKYFNYIKIIIEKDESYLFDIKKLNNVFFNLILWFLDKDVDFNFELLKKKFIYFSPDDQVRILRKLFLYISKNEYNLTIEKLDELTKFDLNLFKTFKDFNTNFPIDISTDIIIKALLSFKNNHRFILENELLTIVLNDLKNINTRQFKISNYFEDCLGRYLPRYNFDIAKGRVSKIFYNGDKFYFAIFIPTSITAKSNNSKFSYGYVDYEPNPDFESHKEKVKRLLGAKWNKDARHWGVPAQFESKVIAFAVECNFFIDFEGDKYKNNTHLAQFDREDVPNGIIFCEGRLANKKDDKFNKEFWWCEGKPCYNKCETIHLANEWEKYTLFDFCNILGYDTDEINYMGDFIPKGKYYHFISLINRFNRLLQKLYCEECEHILYPSDFGTSHFAAHTIVRFQCRNEKCTKKDDEIYLNHCLNGQCNNIIDSRISKKCDNGLFICDDCGSCCSHNMFVRRLSNLKLTGGYIHTKLVVCVNEKLGHLERAEYFCYRCACKMNENGKDIFECSYCNIIYDTTKFHFKRIHLNLSISNPQLDSSSSNYENDNIELPF